MKDFERKHVHFVGIGGVSMSALAQLVREKGAVVTGSDARSGGHSAGNVDGSCDLVIYNGAIADDNPEVLRAKQLGIPLMAREELLAIIEQNYINRIAVAGTHGKSTTVAMIAAVLCEAGLNPTVHNGAVIIDAGTCLVRGGKDFFVTEACEFKRSFLKLNPTLAVITNIDADHLDCYGSLQNIREAFKTFAGKSPAVILNADCPNSGHLCGTSFGIFGGDIRPHRVWEWSRGKYGFCIDDVEVRLSVAGLHNVYNALAAVAVGLHFGVDPETIAKALSGFRGVERRFEIIGQMGRCDVISDFAHHPTELAATITTAKSIYNKFLVVFQPHTFTRTAALFGDFVRVLDGGDTVLFKTYSAREKPIKSATAKDLAGALGCKYFADAAALGRFLNRINEKYDAVILAGAGDLQSKLVDIVAKVM